MNTKIKKKMRYKRTEKTWLLYPVQFCCACKITLVSAIDADSA